MSKKRNAHSHQRQFLVLLIVILFGAVGLRLLQSSQAQTTLGTGTLTLTGASTECPGNTATCTKFQVDCPATGLIATGVIAEGNATGPVRGVVGLFTGSRGDSFYGGGNPGQTSYQLIQNLQSDGFKTYQVKWDNSWVTVPSGADVGSAKAACRPATVIKWLHDNKFAPLGISPDKIGKCGFCVTGNSGGSAQVSYAISHYGLDGIIDAVIPTGGPPWSGLTKGCTGSGDEFYANDGPRMLIDESYGYTDVSGGGPCHLQNAGFASRWDSESIDSSGSDYYHSATRVHFILGDSDLQQIAHSGYYRDRLQSAGTPYMTYQIVANLGHSVQNRENGTAAIRAAILADTGVPVSQPNTVSTPQSPTPQQTVTTPTNLDSEVVQTKTPSSPASSTETLQANSVAEVPAAALSAILNPTEIPKVIKGSWGWLVAISGVSILGGLGFGGWKLITHIKKHEAFKQFMTGIHK